LDREVIDMVPNSPEYFLDDLRESIELNRRCARIALRRAIAAATVVAAAFIWYVWKFLM
jgi:hypothetical protein